MKSDSARSLLPPPVSAFANCGRAVAQVRGSYVPYRTHLACWAFALDYTSMA
jgi:hypothetical protein